MSTGIRDVSFNPDELTRLKHIGGASLVACILDDFLRQAPEQIELIREALEGEDYPSVARLAHSLSSSLGIVGADFASQRARWIESAAHARDHVQLSMDLTQFDVLLSQLLDLLRNERTLWPR